MPRFEETESKTASENKNAAPLEWWESNFVNPLFNSLLVEPVNAVALTFDHATGQKQAHRLAPLPVAALGEDARPPEFICQSAACAMGSVLPYAIAARMAGNTMRFAGAALETEGVLAKVAQSEKLAQIAGGGIYDSMKETRDGETHLRNGLAGAANFGVLEYWKYGPLRRGETQISSRLIAGAVGALAHAAVASPEVLAFNSNVKRDLGREVIAGALMNALLPGTQEGIRRLQDRATMKLGWGIPLERYIKTNGKFVQNSFSSKGESSLIEKNLWARVEPKSQTDAYWTGRDMVSLRDGTSKSTLLHELQHRKEALTGITEPGFVRAANLLEQSPERSWRVYSAVRQAQEIRAELASRYDGISHKSEIVKELKRTLPFSSAAGGVPYIILWRTEFKEFVRSKGKYRPDADYSGRGIDSELHSEANKLQFRLSASQPDAEIAILDVMGRCDLKPEQVAKIFKHCNDILDPRKVELVALPHSGLAMETLMKSAEPERVTQGFLPTCGPASLEFYTYSRHPENAADLISQVVRNQKYDCRDGSTVVLDRLSAIPELHCNRSFSDQLFQNTAVNIHWQRKNSLIPWTNLSDVADSGISPGSVRYQRISTNENDDSPYRILDFSQNPPQPIHNRFSEEYRHDFTDPMMSQSAINDINGQINCGSGEGIMMPRELDSSAEMRDFLKERQSKGMLPVLACVDARHAIIDRNGFRDSPEPLWHAVAVDTFHDARNVVSLFNPWGYRIHNVSLDRFFEAYKAILPTSTCKSL